MIPNEFNGSNKILPNGTQDTATLWGLYVILFFVYLMN